MVLPQPGAVACSVPARVWAAASAAARPAACRAASISAVLASVVTWAAGRCWSSPMRPAQAWASSQPDSWASTWVSPSADDQLIP